MDHQHKSSSNSQRFATRLGVIAATVGSAVGLGNIWRFPYEAGQHGGGAFMLVYLVFILLMGVPVICAEFIIGRHTHRNVYGAFRSLSNRRVWNLVSVVGILASLMILGFYSVVAGWTMEYIFSSISDFGHIQNASELHDRFDAFASSGFRPVMWTVLFLLINFVILRRGVKKGIEKMSNLMMPMLFLILLAFCINSVMMPGAKEGLTFLFKPDFSQIDGKVLLGAMGQAFFSLSLGLGCMITYSSYFRDETPLLKSATITAGLDTLTAILAGVMIFPAVFTFGQTPEAGPKLVFEVLPTIFMSLPGGAIWSLLFFVLLFLASITSTISMSEISIAYFSQEKGMKRTSATMLTTAISLMLGVLSALSFGPIADFKIFGKTIFDLLDFGSSNILLPLGGILISLFVGWVMKRSIVDRQLEAGGHVPAFIVNAIIFCLRFIAPTAIAIILVAGLI